MLSLLPDFSTSWTDASLTSISLAVLAASIVVLAIMPALFSRNCFPLQAKNVLITGGSQGLGLAVACLFAQKGANVCIVARNQGKLDAALKEIETHRKDASQRFSAISADLMSAKGSEDAFAQYEQQSPSSPSPDYVLLCAGGAASSMGLFADLSEHQLQDGMNMNYYTALWGAHSATKAMIKARVKGKIVFVSSVAGLISYAGYSGYSPAKYAIKGLADALRSEMLLYGIGIHCYIPATILTPGLEEENKTKHEITKIIEESDQGSTPELLASKLLSSLESGHFLITTDFFGNVFRKAAAGVSPQWHGLTDIMWTILSPIVTPIARIIADSQVKSYSKKHSMQL